MLVMKLYHELKPVKNSFMLMIVILVLVGMITYTGFNTPIIKLQYKDTRPTHSGSGFGSHSMKLKFEDARPTHTDSSFGSPSMKLKFEDTRPTYTGSGFGSPSMKLQFKDARPTVPFLSRSACSASKQTCRKES